MALDHHTKLKLLLALTLAFIASVSLLDPIPQDPGYHRFADATTIAGIPNSWNVLSNIPFIVVGIFGLAGMHKRRREITNGNDILSCRIFFTGMILTGFGSGYYHLAPANETLLWDRLPMTISFMALFSFILSHHINRQFGRKILWPLLTLGILSVIYWAYTESTGHGDLRFYAVIQFLPVIIIPITLFLFPVTTYKPKYIWMVIALYVLAKGLEHFDHGTYQLTGMGGHSLKHVAAAITGIAFLQAVRSIRR